MARAHTCTTEDEARALASHHLGNSLLAISMLSEPHENETEEQRGKREDSIGRNIRELVGAFGLLSERMRMNGYSNTADWIEEIFEMLATQDLTNPAIRKDIRAKYEALRSGQQAKVTETDQPTEQGEPDIFAKAEAARDRCRDWRDQR